MAPTTICPRLSGGPLLREAFPCQKPSRNHYSCSIRPFRPYSSKSQSAKPRPYNHPPKPKPLVGTRTHTPPHATSSAPSSIPNARSPHKAKPAPKGVLAPYWRISIGVVLCGSLIYSMVTLLPPNLTPKLTDMHASSPPPYSSRRLQSQTETPSQSANPA